MNQKGFTLVELAIVLMIIGLLIGGVLRGQELMNNARIAKTISQVQAYDGAVYTFLDANGAYPGDMAMARSRIPGCTADIQCNNGNGDGIIGTPDNIWQGGQGGVATENTQFWKHLALAHLITGVNPAATTPVWGSSHPAAAIPGGFTVINALSGGGAQQMFGGIVLRLHGCVTCDNVEDAGTGTGNGSPLSSASAGRIDRKMDDGLPGTGDVQASAYGNGADVDQCEVAYTSSEKPFCVMSFMIKR